MKIEFDGGCQPNPGRMYGSYRISIDEAEAFRAERVNLGNGTNNEAEFETLILAIHRALELCELAGTDPGKFAVLILTDSTIVRNRVSLRKKDGYKPDEAAKRMAALAQRCVIPLLRFKSYRIEWNPRACNVETFGH